MSVSLSVRDYNEMLEKIRNAEKLQVALDIAKHELGLINNFDESKMSGWQAVKDMRGLSKGALKKIKNVIG